MYYLMWDHILTTLHGSIILYPLYKDHTNLILRQFLRYLLICTDYIFIFFCGEALIILFGSINFHRVNKEVLHVTDLCARRV